MPRHSLNRHRRPRQRNTVRVVGVASAGAVLPLLGVAQAYAATPSSATSAATLASHQQSGQQAAAAGGGSGSATARTVSAPAAAAPQVDSYTVKAGDTLSGIASQHGMTWQDVYQYAQNKKVIGSNPHRIYAGQKLELCDQGNGAQTTPSTTAAATAPAAGPAASGPMAAAVAFAESKVGQSYLLGGTGANNNWDCSGLTQAAMAHAGISIPRVAADQAAATTRVSLNDLKPGDLLFWSSNGKAGGVYHVAIFTGPGDTFVQAANSSVGVIKETISNYPPSFAGRV